MSRQIARTNFTPSDAELVQLMENNSLGRMGDLRDIARVLHSIDGGLTIFLDASWGQGKTYFVQMLRLLISQINNQTQNAEQTASMETGTEIEPGDFLPVYFNAWENDYWPDPLSALAATLASHSDDIKFASDPSDSDALACLLNLVAELAGSSLFKVAKTIKTTLTGRDLLQEFELRGQLRTKIKEAVNTLLQERANKLLLIIDELDRCRPDYAVLLLEELKALFELDNVVVLYSVNTQQLSKTVEGIYGAGFDGLRYLSRFYDVKFALRPVASSDYLSSKGISQNRVDELVINELINYHNLSLRETNQLLELCQDYRDELEASAHFPIRMLFPLGYIAPILKALSILNPDGYTQTISRGEPSFLLDEVRESELLTSWGNRLIDPSYNPAQPNTAILDFLPIFCTCLWGKKADGDKWYDALNELRNDWNSDLREVIQYASTVRW